jgi:hypothetical protein
MLACTLTIDTHFVHLSGFCTHLQHSAMYKSVLLHGFQHASVLIDDGQVVSAGMSGLFARFSRGIGLMLRECGCIVDDAFGRSVFGR